MTASGVLADTTPLPATYQGAAPPLNLPPLQGALRADVAIVGAGFTGLSAALHLAQEGCSVVVLEAREVGWGGSGRAFGQVVPYAKHDEAHILASFGPEWGERLIAALGEGPGLVRGLIEAHAMPCELACHGLLFAAHAPSARAGLERRAAVQQRRGAPVEMVYGAALHGLTGSRAYLAALLDRRGFCLNPLAYARGLARAALAAGARIFEASPAERLDPGWRIRTPQGELAADQVVLATDAYTGALWPGLASSILPLRAHQVVSRPLPANQRPGVLPGGQGLTDTRRLYSGIRMRLDGRLHLSVDGPAFTASGAGRVALAARRVRALFPDLPPLEWEHAVSGWVGLSRDQYPHIHRLGPGVLAAIGLSGRGIAFGTLLGLEVTRRVLGRPPHEWALPDTRLRPIPFRPLAPWAAAGLLAYARLRDAAELSVGRSADSRHSISPPA